MSRRLRHVTGYEIIMLVIMTLMTTGLSAQEICDNRIDDDGDGLIDCLDPDCNGDNSCWDCSTEFYQVHSNSTVVALDPANGTYTTLASVSGATDINGAQMNPLDGHVYAPTKIGGVHTLGMLRQDGSVVDLGFSLNASNIFYAGAIDINGFFYVGRGGQNLEKIDLSATPLTAVTTNISWPGVADLAYDKVNNLFYGVNGSAKLVVIDPVAEAVNNYDLAGSINSVSGAFGAAWSSSDGSFFASNNSSGKIYSIDIANLQSTEVINATGNLSINDGFNCFNAPPPFESKCGNGTDDDGDGLIDCADPDCVSDTNCLTEVCNNGIDDDGDGLADCDDPECQVISSCIEICDNGIDDNGNGLVDGADLQCQVSTSKNGGLESNRRLASNIVQRNFERRKSDEKLLGRDELKPYSQRTQQEKSLNSIADFIPDDAIDGAELFVNSPTDLVDITNAKEVFAVDIFMLDRRVASVLAMTTKNAVYEHTKYICDRLNGASLEDISTALIHDSQMLTAEIIQPSGRREYTMSFSAFESGSQYQIENYWNLDRYTTDKQMYNFQIWADQPEHLYALAEAIISRMDNDAGIAKIKSMEAPKLFVQNGKYENGTLTLNIKNKGQARSAEIVGSMTASETSYPQQISKTIDLNQLPSQTIRVDLGSVFDVGFRVRHDGDDAFDDLFFADGVWGVDVTDGGILHNFEVKESMVETHTAIAYALERNPVLDVSLSTGATLYRSLKPNFRPVDCSVYNTLKFNTEYDGDIEITLIKSTIDEWAHQPKAIVRANDNGKVMLRLDNLKHEIEEQVDLSDVQAVLFTVKNHEQVHQRIYLDIDQLRFDFDESVLSASDLEQDGSMAFPNPSNSLTNILWDSAVANHTDIIIYDASGRLISSHTMHSAIGLNQLELNVQSLAKGIYYYTIQAEGQSIKSGKLTRM